MQLRPVAVDVRGRPSQGEGVQNNLMCAAQLVITEEALAAPNQAGRRAFSSNSLITQCDALCKLAGIRPRATATCTQVADGPGQP